MQKKTKRNQKYNTEIEIDAIAKGLLHLPILLVSGILTSGDGWWLGLTLAAVTLGIVSPQYWLIPSTHFDRMETALLALHPAHWLSKVQTIKHSW